MKLSDVVIQLSKVLPGISDRFSNSAECTATAVSGTVTASTVTPHGLKTGDAIAIINQSVRTPINSIFKSGSVFTLTTAEDHDLTLRFYESVSLGGFTLPAWNSNFQLVAVENRQKFGIKSDNTLPILNGGEYLNEVRIDGLNGYFKVTVIDPNTFTYESPDLSDNTYNFTFNTGVRVAGVVNYERAAALYTQLATVNNDHCWAFAYFGDASVSKDRSLDNDAVAARNAGDDERTRVIETVTVAVIIPTTNETAAAVAIDIARFEIFPLILKSINGIKFDNGLCESGAFRLNFVGHGEIDYNRAYYSHYYTFENVFDITQGDNVAVGNTRAFRDIDELLDYSDPMSANFSLDDEPI